MNQKEVIRNRILRVRDNLDKNEKKENDKIIYKKIIELNAFKKAKIVFTYVNMKSEINTLNIINYCFENDKVVCVPKVNFKNKTMDAYKIKSIKELQKGHYGVLEPNEKNEIISPYSIDLAIFPGLAFNENGYRIGYGGGYYDKYFSDYKIKATKVAVAYDFQILNKFTEESHDVAVDCIITD